MKEQPENMKIAKKPPKVQQAAPIKGDIVPPIPRQTRNNMVFFSRSSVLEQRRSKHYSPIVNPANVIPCMINIMMEMLKKVASF